LNPKIRPIEGERADIRICRRPKSHS